MSSCGVLSCTNTVSSRTSCSGSWGPCGSIEWTVVLRSLLSCVPFDPLPQGWKGGSSGAEHAFPFQCLMLHGTCRILQVLLECSRLWPSGCALESWWSHTVLPVEPVLLCAACSSFSCLHFGVVVCLCEKPQGGEKVGVKETLQEPIV